MNILNETVVESGLEIEFCDLARFCILFIDVLHSSHVCLLGVAQDSVIHLNNHVTLR